MIKIKKYQIEDYISDATQDALDLKADLVDGKVPASQLPSFVDDVIEVANYAALPIPGATGVIYITLDTNKVYRWTGSVYVEIASGSTNLSYTPGVSDGTVNSDTGTDATIPLAGVTNAGLFSAAEKTKLAGIAAGANVGVVPNAPITGATKTKITYDSKGLVTVGEDATTADIADSTNKRYVTDANLTVINNTSGTNTGDNATNSQYSGLAASKQDNITLTTTGTSGASTLVGSTLNIPQYSGATNLSYTASPTNGIVNSSTGTGATITLADATNSGLLKPAKFTVLENTSGTNTGDQTLQQVTNLGATTTNSITADSFVKSGGTSSQILAADGSVITAGTNITITGGQISSIGGTGGGGSSVNYYLNGGTSQGTFEGTTYYEFSKTAVIGTGADFNISSNGYIASFITDVADPSLLLIPGGNWNLEFFFSSSSAGGSPSFYVELYKYDGTTFTLIASSSATPEGITGGTSIDAYFTALAVPETVLTVNDRLAIRVFVNASSKTITLHTQNGHLCEVITTFTAGLTALNGLQAQVQNFATGTTGTDFAIVSSGSTHTFNLPSASATARGVVTTGTQTFTGAKTFGQLKTNFTSPETIASIAADGTITGLNTVAYPSFGELSYVKGVTSGIQTQFSGKQPLSTVLTNTTASFTIADETKLDGIAIGANVGVVPNTAITGATKTKITYDSKGLVTAGVDATTADIADSTDKRYQTDNQELYNDATSSIQTQLDSKSSFLISESGSLGQVTGTSTNTIAASFLIPALPLFANKSLQINYTVLKVNSVSTCTVRLYINSTNSLTGATLLATSAFTTAQQVSNTTRTMGNIGAPFYLFYNPASSVFHDYLAFAYNPINILAGNYIIVAFQLGSPSEEARLRAINLRIL
jgi:hypothetical protein